MLLLAPAPALAKETISYSYDALGRLIAADHAGSVNNGLKASYAYDAADNRTAVTVVGATSTTIVVPLNGLTVLNVPRR
ncbi:RHS repeat domain-containing protein [Sphingomonas crusticola]|uniref:RHS repeat domain-containing protein n=1 Tax=Sphingomonas crusticola TaxID=1697973 RepID=UPI001F07C6B0|nr:RHS repeat domain-containing protein [Sphingomonas crusticola]